MRGLIWLAAGLVVALLAAYVVFVSLSRATAAPVEQAAAGPQAEVVVATRALPQRTLLTAGDVEVRKLPASAVPIDAVHTTDEAIGQLTTADLYEGEVLVPARLLKPNTVGADGRTAFFMTENEVLVAIPAQDQLSKAGVIKTGDHVDLLFSLDFPTDRTAGQTESKSDKEPATFDLLQNVPVVGLIGAADATATATGTGTAGTGTADGAKSGGVQTILLTVSPQDALALKYAFDAGGAVSMALRAPGVDRTYDTEPVDVDYMINRYKIPYQIGK